MLQSWSARYLDGLTARADRVTVVPATHGLEIRRVDGGTVVWSYAEITQSQGSYDGEPVRFERGVEPTEVLVVDDPAILSRLHQVAALDAQRFHNPGSPSRRPAFILAALAATVVLGAGLYLWAIPAVTTFAAEQVPVSWEEQLGEVVTNSLIGSLPHCEDKAVASAVDDLVQRLAATLPGNPYRFQVSVVRHDLMNAFAAPGGHIVVFSGLLSRTARPEELAGVLAHEMSHVVRRHGTKSLFREVSTSVFLAALIGDVSGGLGLVLENARTLGGLHYSRQAEDEADLDGLKMLVAARLDPDGMLDFFEKLQSRELRVNQELLKYFSTHPLTPDRIARLKAEQGNQSGVFTTVPSAARWTSLAKACNPGRTAAASRSATPSH